MEELELELVECEARGLRGEEEVLVMLMEALRAKDARERRGFAVAVESNSDMAAAGVRARMF